jgi:hypothetical protein
VPGKAHGRVYLPLSPTLLRRAREDGGFEQPPISAHAVTPELVSELGSPDEEESEYAALSAAALESLWLLRPDEPPRRVVAAVDVPAWEPRPDQESSAVSVPTRVPWRRVAAVHVDGEDASADVAAALGGATEAVVRCLDHELGWYAVQEVDELLEHLSWGS